MSVWHKKISEVLTLEEYLLQSNPDLPVEKAKLSDLYKDENVREVYEDLGGLGSLDQISLRSVDFWVGEYYALIDDALRFHRYRLATFRSPAYQNINLDISNYRRYCRQFESECIKAGVRDDLWTNPEAENHFGRAAEAGDFFGAGSPGWKYTAFQDFLLDAYAYKANISLLRLPIYANFMVGGKLERFDKLLLKGDEQSKKYVSQHLARLLTK